MTSEPPQSAADAAGAEDWHRKYTEIAQLAGGLAHEIRNPLSTIRLNIETLAESLEQHDDPDSRRLLNKAQMIDRECHRVERILGAFLQFAKAGHIELESRDLSELVRQFVRFFEPEAAECDVTIQTHLAAGLPEVAVDEALMRQVFGNLARNAIEAMPEGGVLAVSTMRTAVDEDEPRVVLELIDAGLGMTADQKARMFDVFYSMKPGGSGLGLPTVRKIVEAHGGRLECESEVGKGTRFRVILPAIAE